MSARLQQAIPFAESQVKATANTLNPNSSIAPVLYPSTQANFDGTWKTSSLAAVNGVAPTYFDEGAGLYTGQLWQLYALTGDSTLRTLAYSYATPLVSIEANSENEFDRIEPSLLPLYLDQLKTDASCSTKACQATQASLVASANAKLSQYVTGLQFINSSGSWYAAYVPIYNTALNCTNYSFNISGSTENNFYSLFLDQTMDLSLVLWVAANIKSSSFDSNGALEKVNNHLHAVQNYLLRSDGGVHQYYYFNSTNDTPIQPLMYQGSNEPNFCEHWANDKAGMSNPYAGFDWSRGQGWAMYSFTVAASQLSDPSYLQSALQLSNYFVAHLPSDDSIPFWDFGENPIEEQVFVPFLGQKLPHYKDAAAGAVGASALLKLYKLITSDATLSATYPSQAHTYLATAQKILFSLSGAPYLSQGQVDPTCLALLSKDSLACIKQMAKGVLAMEPVASPGIILHGAANVPSSSGYELSTVASQQALTAPGFNNDLSYADYFYLEALKEYQALGVPDP